MTNSKSIEFYDRTQNQLMQSTDNLKIRYKSVELVIIKKSPLFCNGYFLVVPHRTSLYKREWVRNYNKLCKKYKRKHYEQI